MDSFTESNPNPDSHSANRIRRNTHSQLGGQEFGDAADQWPGRLLGTQYNEVQVEISTQQEAFTQQADAHHALQHPRLSGGRTATNTTTLHTHTHLTALFPWLPRWAGTRKVKPIWLLKQETVSGSGISWAICKCASRCRQITMPTPHHSVFYRPDALPAAQPTVSKHWRAQHNNINNLIYIFNSVRLYIPYSRSQCSTDQDGIWRAASL